MFTVMIKNLLTDKTFERTFDSPFQLRKFLIKCKYSKKVKVLSVIGDMSQSVMSEVANFI